MGRSADSTLDVGLDVTDEVLKHTGRWDTEFDMPDWKEDLEGDVEKLNVKHPFKNNVKLLLIDPVYDEPWICLGKELASGDWNMPTKVSYRTIQECFYGINMVLRGPDQLPKWIENRNISMFVLSSYG